MARSCWNLRAHAEAVTTTIGAPLAMPAQEAARGIAEIVDETMASAARVHAVENGKETSGRTLIAFGGAAPLHAARLAQKLGIRRVVVPPDAGVGSALGFLGAPVAYEVVRTLLVRLDALEQRTIDALFADMRAEAEAVVRLGVPTGCVDRMRTGFMRYRGQGHEVAVLLPDGALDPAALRAAFDATYARVYGRVIPRLEVEAVTWTLSLAEPHDLPERLTAPADRRPPHRRSAVPHRSSRSGEAVMRRVFVRAALQRVRASLGQRSIVEDGTSTIVPPGLPRTLAAGGEIVIEDIEP